MAWLTPYTINGAAHSAALFRRQAQRPASDQVGVSRPGDLKVRALSVPGQGFRVAVGGASIPSRYSGRARESYGVENGDSQITVEGVNGTGSASTRRDLVVVEVLDHNHMGITWEEAEALNFMRVRIVEGVGASVTRIEQLTSTQYQTMTGYAIAAINWPKSTGTVTDDMIEDLREVAQPREKTVVRAFGVSGSSERLTNNTIWPGGTTWPDATRAEANFGIEIPEWATQVLIIMTVSGVQMNNVDTSGGDASGWFWVQLGTNTNPDVRRTEATRWDADKKAATHRTIFRTADTISVPAAFRGTTQRFFPRGNVRSESQAPGTVYSGPRELNPYIPFPIADLGSSVDLTVVFREVKE